MEDQERLRLTQDALENVIREHTTWEQYKYLLETVTRQQLINAIENKLRQKAQSLRDSAIAGTANAIGVDALADEIDQL